MKKLVDSHNDRETTYELLLWAKHTQLGEINVISCQLIAE